MIVFLLLLFLVSPLYARKHEDVEDIGNRKINGRVAWVFPNFVSFEKELQIGADYARLLEETVKLVEDPVVLSYISELGQQIVRRSDAKAPFVIKVIDSDEVNAFALPGGFFYINKGLILEVENEAELVGVMAHEIAHVTARHATENMTKGQLIQIAAIPALFVGGGYWAQVGIRQGLGLGISLGILGISRGSEAEADQLGTQYAWNAGYDPEGFITFFEKLQAREKDKPGKFSSFFRTHPTLENRIEKVQEEIGFLPRKEYYIVTSSRLGLIQERLRVPETRVGSGVGRPTLKRKPTISGEEEKKKERPTLKRGDEE